jgi:flavin-binding protein dodecin
MAELDSKEAIDRLATAVQNLTIAQVRTEERVIAAGIVVEHFNANLKMRLDGFATRIELASLRGDMEDLKDDRKWLTRAVWGGWLAGLAVVWAAFTKKFGG